MSKVSEKDVNKQFPAYLEENKLTLNFIQFGFKNNESTEFVAITLVEEIRRNVDSGWIAGACFLDLSIAFDTISHAKLVSRLTSYGVNGLNQGDLPISFLIAKYKLWTTNVYPR